LARKGHENSVIDVKEHALHRKISDFTRILISLRHISLDEDKHKRLAYVNS